ncbi:MAG TPA: hypothetical protein PKW95_21105 [bacterium]|nr:hypothetical protein [bacterium]
MVRFDKLFCDFNYHDSLGPIFSINFGLLISGATLMLILNTYDIIVLPIFTFITILTIPIVYVQLLARKAITTEDMIDQNNKIDKIYQDISRQISDLMESHR